MDVLKDGWFSEVCDLWPGSCHSFEVEAVLYKKPSRFQNIMVLQTKCHGRALVLKDVLQFVEADAFSYNEMLTFLPLCNHPCPKKVLIVGGGSGGTAKEVLKHPAVEQLDVLEFDETVLEVCQQFLSETTSILTDPKVTVFAVDTFEFLKLRENYYDVIITDGSEPVGPPQSSLRELYFELKKNALRPGGVISMQAGSVWIASNSHAPYDLPSYTMNRCRKVFGNAAYASVSVPSFESGQVGIAVACTDMEVDLKKPTFVLQDSFLKEQNLRYYSPKVHKAAFVIPRYLQTLLEKKE